MNNFVYQIESNRIGIFLILNIFFHNSGIKYVNKMLSHLNYSRLNYCSFEMNNSKYIAHLNYFYFIWTISIRTINILNEINKKNSSNEHKNSLNEQKNSSNGHKNFSNELENSSNEIVQCFGSVSFGRIRIHIRKRCTVDQTNRQVELLPTWIFFQ